jgi:hypothetical protein
MKWLNFPSQHRAEYCVAVIGTYCVAVIGTYCVAVIGTHSMNVQQCKMLKILFVFA